MTTTDTGRFDKAFARFRILVWAALALSFIDVLLSPELVACPSPMREMVFACIALLYGFAAWLNVLLLRGRNWVRIFWVVSMLAWIPPFMDWSALTGPHLYLAVVEVALFLWTIYVMFTDPIRQHFARKDAVARPAGG